MFLGGTSSLYAGSIDEAFRWFFVGLGNWTAAYWGYVGCPVGWRMEFLAPETK